jgi:hypothetical protein
MLTAVGVIGFRRRKRTLRFRRDASFTASVSFFA